MAKDSFNKLEAHQRIPQLLREFEAASDLDAAKGKLTELRDLLEAHFAEEELTGGFFDELREVQPGNVPKIKELTEEHGALLARADTLQEALDGLSFEQAQPKIEELCAGIRCHHECEHQLFLDSYLIDHGGE